MCSQRIFTVIKKRYLHEASLFNKQMRGTILVLFLVSYCYASDISPILWKSYGYSSAACIVNGNDTIVIGTISGDIIWTNATTGEFLAYVNLTLPIGTCVSDGTFIYFGTLTSPSHVYRYDLNYHNISSQGYSLLSPSDDYLSASFYYKGFIFFGTNTSPAKMVKFDTTSFTRADGIQFSGFTYSYVRSIQVFNDKLLFAFNTSSGAAATVRYNETLVSQFGGSGSELYPTTGVIYNGFAYYLGYSNSVLSFNLSYVFQPTIYPLSNYISSDVTVSMLKDSIIYFATQSGTIASFNLNNYTTGAIYGISAYITCGFRSGDYLYFGGSNANNNTQIVRQYIGNDCPDAKGGILLSGSSRTVYNSVPSCSTACVNGTISCLNGILSGDTNYNYTSCTPLHCECNYTADSKAFSAPHNSTTLVYYYSTPVCGNCSYAIIFCNNKTLTIYNTSTPVNTSNIHTSCPGCTRSCNFVNGKKNTTLLHNTTTYYYASSCGNCTLVPVQCLDGNVTPGNYSNLSTTCLPYCGCKLNDLIFPFNYSIPVYLQSEYCGNCADIQTSVYCSQNGTLVGNSSLYTNCTSFCHVVDLFNSSVNATLENVVVYFPQVSNYTAAYSIANNSNGNLN